MCKPCKESNVQLTQLKDTKFLGTDPEIDDIVANFMTNPSTKVPGCAIGVVYENQIVYLKAYGLAELGSLELTTVPPISSPVRPFTIGTPSGIGSISKTVTALAALKLVEQNKIDLNASIGTYLPLIPTQWNDITVHQLLSHTSGLPRDPIWSDYPSTEADLMDIFPGEHPGIHPRHAYWTLRFTNPTPLDAGSARYSNHGYALLGAIVDIKTVSDVWSDAAGYENFIHGTIGMNDYNLSGPTMLTPCLNAYWRYHEIPDLARGYRFEDGEFVEVPPTNTGPDATGWWGPPGGWTMTIGDLTRLMLLINTHMRISPGLTDLMLTEHGHDQSLGEAQCGYGVLLLQKLGKDVFMHGGDIHGYSARFVMWPDDGVGVAVLCNRRDGSDGSFGSGKLGAITENVAELVMNRGGVRLEPTAEDRERERMAVYHVSSHYEQDIAKIVDMYIHRYGSPEKALRHELSRLYRTQYGKQMVRAFRDGKFEAAAEALLRLLASRKTLYSGPPILQSPPPEYGS